MKYNMLDLKYTCWEKLLSLAEAAEIWGKEESTIRRAIKESRLLDGEECRKFGKQWVVNIEGMIRLYGKEPWERHLYNLYEDRRKKETSQTLRLKYNEKEEKIGVWDIMKNDWYISGLNTGQTFKLLDIARGWIPVQIECGEKNEWYITEQNTERQSYYIKFDD